MTCDATYLPIPCFPQEGADWRRPASPEKLNPRHRCEALPSVLCAEHVWSVPTHVHKVTHRWRCARNQHGHVHTRRHRARRPAHTETVTACKDVCALTDHGDTCTLEPQTRPGCLPHAHLQEGFPARCSSHAPNKSQLIRTLPLNRSPPLGCDQISTQGRKRKSPLFRLLRLLLRCRSTQRGCLRALPPLSIMPRITGTVTGRSSGLGFNPGELQPQAA